MKVWLASSEVMHGTPETNAQLPEKEGTSRWDGLQTSFGDPGQHYFEKRETPVLYTN